MPPPLLEDGFKDDEVLTEYGEYELGGETLGEPTWDTGAECDTLDRGGGINWAWVPE